VGISLMTLQRWIAAGKVSSPPLRIWHGRATRIWTKSDLARLHETKTEVYCKGRGRKKKMKA